jgi:hypothetical protein
MRVFLIAVALATSILATGCGGSGRGNDLSRYITQVNVIEQSLARPLLAISKANRDFARGREGKTSVVTRLRRSERTLHKLDLRLASVPAPPEARHLRALLVELGMREESLAGEVVALAIFLPKFEKALTPLAPASAQLKRALAAKVALREKIAALEDYAARLQTATARLRPLRPPPSSRPAWSQQIATLGRVRASARALADGLRKKRAKAIPKLLHAFDVAAVGNQSLAAQRARIGAVVAYNRRIKGLNRLNVTIAREQTRLLKN